MNAKRLLISILVLGLRALPAYASLLTYSTASSFNAANTDQTFQNISFAQGNLGTSFTDALTSVVFSASAGMTGAMQPSGWPAGTVVEITNSPNTNTITVTPPSSVRSVAFYAGSGLAFNTFNIAASNTGGDNFNNGSFQQSSSTAPVFFGVRSDTPFVSISVQTFGSNPVPVSDILDDVEVGSPEQTPEAATMLLIATGLFMIRYGGRWLPRGPA